MATLPAAIAAQTVLKLADVDRVRLPSASDNYAVKFTYVMGGVVGSADGVTQASPVVPVSVTVSTYPAVPIGIEVGAPLASPANSVPVARGVEGAIA